jgi:hypothetical protein
MRGGISSTHNDVGDAPQQAIQQRGPAFIFLEEVTPVIVGFAMRRLGLRCVCGVLFMVFVRCRWFGGHFVEM